jgi:2,4'-dihydroxyacetophenone dioxygenase
MTPYRFDDRKIAWQPFGEFPHFVFSILQVDMQQRIADVIFKFAAGQQIVLHRHKALNHTFVIQGEHRCWRITKT